MCSILLPSGYVGVIQLVCSILLPSGYVGAVYVLKIRNRKMNVSTSLAGIKINVVPGP